MDEKKHIPKPSKGFVKVKCEGCGNEQNIFTAPASTVKCLVCGNVLAESSSSMGDIKAKSVKELK